MVARPLDGGEFRGARQRLVEELQTKGIRDLAVLRAFEMTPRHAFLPSGIRHRAYEDAPLPIGSGQTISQPFVQARYLELLQLAGKERVLEVGTGSGYQAAVLSHLCANVYSVERIAALGVRARRLLEQLGIYNVAVQLGDGTIGWRSEAPFDAIIVTAGSPTPPRPLLAQLRGGGRLVVPVGQDGGQALLRLRVTEQGVEEEVIGDCRFVPLLGRFGFAR